MGSPSITGAWAIVQGFAQILKGNLAQSVAEVEAAAAVSWSLDVPDSHDDWSVSMAFTPTWLPRNRFNAIQIWCDSTVQTGSFISAHAGIEDEVVVGALWLVHDRDPNILEQKKQLGTQAIKRCLHKYWRRDMSDAAIYDVRFEPTDFRFSSMRQQGGSSRGLIGHVTDTGDNIDAVVVGIRCKQRVDAPILL